MAFHGWVLTAAAAIAAIYVLSQMFKERVPDSSGYVDGPIRFAILASIIWGIAGFLVGDDRQESVLGAVRIENVRERRSDHGLEADEQLIVGVPARFEDGIEAVDRLWALKTPPTAVVAFNDRVALGVRRGLLQKGLEVPRDCSVVGSDATEAGAYADVPLTTIALPHDWCGYGEVIEGFKKKYPEIQVNELNPDAGSADEVEAIKANKGNTGPQAPDVVDVGLGFGPSMKDEGLLQPYKVSTWGDIPDSAKDADGYWYGDYYGVMAFLVNKDMVANTPKDWADLLKPEYAGQVALAGDPRASAQAIASIQAAGLAKGAAAGEAAGKAGLEYFADMNKSGNFVPVIAKAGTLAQGTTPILIAWDYNVLSWQQQMGDNPPTDVVIPETGVLAGVYIQGISAYAPHPNAAKLWMEYLYSDEGQNAWLRGYCHPIRFNAMAAAGTLDQEAMKALPPAEAYAKAYFPTLAEQDANKKVVVDEWDSVVGANVQ